MKNGVKQSEKELVKVIIDYLLLKGCYVWINDTVGIYDKERGVWRRRRHNSYKPLGISDVIGLTKEGRFVAIEVKTPEGHSPTETQKAFLKRVEENQGIAFIARSLEDVENAFPI